MPTYFFEKKKKKEKKIGKISEYVQLTQELNKNHSQWLRPDQIILTTLQKRKNFKC